MDYLKAAASLSAKELTFEGLQNSVHRPVAAVAFSQFGVAVLVWGIADFIECLNVIAFGIFPKIPHTHFDHVPPLIEFVCPDPPDEFGLTGEFAAFPLPVLNDNPLAVGQRVFRSDFCLAPQLALHPPLFRASEILFNLRHMPRVFKAGVESSNCQTSPEIAPVCLLVGTSWHHRF